MDFETGHFADFKQFGHFANFQQFKIDCHFLTLVKSQLTYLYYFG